MEIFTTVDKLCDQYPHITMALGTFDGIHCGHQAVIAQAVALARQHNGTSAVFTFSNHPLSVIAPERCPQRLVTAQHKAQLLKSLGVDILLNIEFTPQLLKYTPEQFVDLMYNQLRPRQIVVGPNYTFGYKSMGDPHFLSKAGLEKNFTVVVQPGVYLDGTLVSSTLIRRLVAAGQVDQAARLLGRPFRLTGEVTGGNQQGRQLGFPTANLHLPSRFAIPDNGVYAAYAYLDGDRYCAVVNVGTNPTFQGVDRHVEVHLLNFNRDIYGQLLEVDFLHKIRAEETFQNADALVRQIGRDIETAKQYYQQP